VSPPWCDTLVNDELHVASVALIVGGFSSTPVGGMQANLADQTACSSDGACFMSTLSLRTAYVGCCSDTAAHSDRLFYRNSDGVRLPPLGIDSERPLVRFICVFLSFVGCQSCACRSLV